MPCLLACFQSSNKRKHHKSVCETPTKQDQSLEFAEENAGNSIELVYKSKDKVEEQCCVKKRVTFDLNMETYEEPKEVINKDLAENDETSIEMEPLLVFVGLSKVESCNSNYRYQDCRDSTEYEYEDIGLEGCDSEGNKHTIVQEESSESLFSISLDSRKKNVSGSEMEEKEVCSPMLVSITTSLKKEETIGFHQNPKDNSQSFDVALNPIENLNHWKEEIKEREKGPNPSSSNHKGKENVSLGQDLCTPISSEPKTKLQNHNLKTRFTDVKPEEQLIGVDASLSSCLVESENTPNYNTGISSHSEEEKSHSHENRLIPGASDKEERKLLSDSSSPRRERTPSPHDTPIGTVGSYWIHTGQNMDSDSSSSSRVMPTPERKQREVQIMNCDSTPFEAKLDGVIIYQHGCC